MENQEVLGILNELDAEDKALAARQRGRARIREVIIHYQYVLTQTPKAEQNLKDLQTSHDEIKVRLDGHLTALRDELTKSREEVRKEKEALDKDQNRFTQKRKELQNQLEATEKSTTTRLNVFAEEIKAYELRLLNAKKAFEEFKQQHVNV